MPQYGQPPEEKLAYRSLLGNALQQRGFGNQSAIAVMERPPKGRSHTVRNHRESKFYAWTLESSSVVDGRGGNMPGFPMFWAVV